MSTRSTRAQLIRTLAIAVIVGAVALVVVNLVPGSSERLRHLNAGWVALGIVLEVLALTGYVLLFHGAFSYGEHRIGYVRSAQIGVGELGAYAVAPSGAGGAALRVWALLRSGMPFRVLMTRSVVHAIIFNLPYIGAALLLGLLVAGGGGIGHAPLELELAPLALVAGSIVLAVGATVLARRFRHRPRARWRRIGRDVVQAVPSGLQELPARLRRPVLLPSAIAYWAGDCAVLVVAFHSVHGSAPVSLIVLAYMLGQLGNALPVPGGVGAVEPAMLGILTASGVSLGLGAAAVVLYRLISLGLQAVLGGIAVSTLVPALQPAPAEPATAA